MADFLSLRYCLYGTMIAGIIIPATGPTFFPVACDHCYPLIFSAIPPIHKLPHTPEEESMFQAITTSTAAQSGVPASQAYGV